MKSIERIKAKTFEWILGKLQSNVLCVVEQKNVLFQHSFVRQMWGGWDRYNLHQCITSMIKHVKTFKFCNTKAFFVFLAILQKYN
jgi:hypothetical protein